MNAPGKSNLKRKTIPAQSEPLNKSIKISDESKDSKINLNTMKKADLIKYCEELLQQNNLLLEEKKKIIDSQKGHLKTIESLKEKVKDLEHDIFLCGECDFVAECIHDFNDHTHSPEELENNENSLFTCKFCDERFETLPEVMMHTKMVHPCHVQHCNKYLENTCLYGDNCWFLHSETFKNSEPRFKCKFCDKNFLTTNALKEHNKKLHIQLVSKCKNEEECKFGPKKCWFLHKEDIENAYINEKSEGRIK